MAKKKKSPKQPFNFHRVIIFILVILVIGLLIGLLYQEKPHLFKKSYYTEQIEDTIAPSKKKEETPKPEKKTKPTVKPKPTPAPPAKQTTKFDIRSVKGLDIPAALDDRPEQIIKHSGFTLSYNSKWKVSNWVGYELTHVETQGDEKRTNKFVVDPKVKGATATDSDYRGSGYDRGHMAPAADMSWSKDAMKESFYFSNMTPQTPNLNRGIWKTLEDRTRKWAERDSAIIVICGPVMNDTSKTIGKNKVLVPAQFYKVILSPYGKTPKAIGFLFDNEGSLKTLDAFAVSVDKIERLTGIDFFHQLPDSLEDRIEGSYNLKDWF